MFIHAKGKDYEIEKSDYEMLISCFTYNSAFEGNRYYDELVKKYGKAMIELFVSELSEAYEIKYNVYEDSEGCTYNELIPRT